MDYHNLSFIDIKNQNIILNKKNTQLNNIIQEYCLKRNIFNPKKPSPNKFVNKLQLRMKVYYKNLYNASNSVNKY